jgi:hypothetical protein
VTASDWVEIGLIAFIFIGLVLTCVIDPAGLAAAKEQRLRREAESCSESTTGPPQVG